MRHKIPFLLAAAGLGAGAANADNGIAVGAIIGTTGASAEVQAQVTPYVQIRGGFNYFQYSVDDTWDDIAYDGDLDLTNFGAFADLRPWGNSFIVSGGAFIGDKGLNVAATPVTDVEIGGQTFTPAQVGTLNLDAEMENLAPFLGLGFDTTFQGSSNWGFRLVGGAMFTGTPAVSLTSTGGTLSGDPSFEAELRNEEANLQSDIDGYEVYPVVQAGLTFRF